MEPVTRPRGILATPVRVVATAMLAAAVVAACAGAPASPEPPPLPSPSNGPTAAAASAPPAPSPTTTPGTAAGLVGVAVIGHSGATGYNSDPGHPGTDAEANSWATGTNPAVQSIYLRLLAEDAEVEGHATNLAIDGSNVTSLIPQATQLVSRRPAPQFVLVQTIDNDIRCDGSDPANYGPFRAALTEALAILHRGLPDSQIFVVSQWAAGRAYDQVMAAVSPRLLQGPGPCDTLDPASGAIVPAREAYVQSLIDAYWQIATQVCGRVALCRTDGGVMQTMELVPGDLTSDFGHLSVAGQAAMAGLEWPILADGG